MPLLKFFNHALKLSLDRLKSFLYCLLLDARLILHAKEGILGFPVLSVTLIRRLQSLIHRFSDCPLKLVHFLVCNRVDTLAHLLHLLFEPLISGILHEIIQPLAILTLLFHHSLPHGGKFLH